MKPTAFNPPKPGDVFVIRWDRKELPDEVMLVVEIGTFDAQEDCWTGRVFTPTGEFRTEWMFVKDEWL